MINIIYITTYYTKYTVNFFNNLTKIKNSNFTFVYPKHSLPKNSFHKKFNKIILNEKNIFDILEDKYEICYYKLSGLENLIKKIKPNIIIVHNRHVLNFVLNKRLIELRNKIKFKIYYRTIPFIIPDCNIPLYKSYKGKNIIKKILLKTRILDFFVFNYYKFIFNKIDHFLTYIPLGKKIISSYGIKKNKITTVFNSPDTNELDQIEKEINKKITKKYDLIYVGSLSHWKKVDILIEALALFKKRKINLLIVGEGITKKTIMKNIYSKNLTKKVFFAGSVYKKKKLYKLLKQSKIFVLPGPGGLAINEAMHAGLPIICSEADGTEKVLVKNNYNGFFFKKDNHLDLYNKINYLLKNQNQIFNMGHNSRNIITNLINSNLINKNYETAFKK